MKGHLFAPDKADMIFKHTKKGRGASMPGVRGVIVSQITHEYICGQTTFSGIPDYQRLEPNTGFEKIVRRVNISLNG